MIAEPPSLGQTLTCTFGVNNGGWVCRHVVLVCPAGPGHIWPSSAGSEILLPGSGTRPAAATWQEPVLLSSAFMVPDVADCNQTPHHDSNVALRGCGCAGCCVLSSAPELRRWIPNSRSSISESMFRLLETTHWPVVNDPPTQMSSRCLAWSGQTWDRQDDRREDEDRKWCPLVSCLKAPNYHDSPQQQTEK